MYDNDNVVSDALPLQIDLGLTNASSVFLSVYLVLSNKKIITVQ